MLSKGNIFGKGKTRKETNKQTKFRGFLVCKRTVPAELPLLINEGSANICGERL
jgi:hypothetical protein